MVALNQQFAVLATFCSLAAVSLFPPANAAAIQGRAPSKHIETGQPVHHHSPIAPFPGAKHANGPHQKAKSKLPKGKQHRTRTLDWSPIAHVLRMVDMTLGATKRYHYANTEKRHQQQAHFHQTRDADAHVSRHDHHQRQSSVVIPSNRGGTFLVSPAQRSPQAGQGTPTKREDKLNGVPGRVDIMSDAPTGSKKIGSLVMDNSTRVLNASDTDFTRMNMIKPPSGNSQIDTRSGQDSKILVSLQIPSGLSKRDTVSNCATTNGETLAVEKCSGAKSQMFAYNEKTGTIQPMWFMGQDDDKATPSSADAVGVTNVIDGRDGTGEPASAKNVTLMFVPDAPEIASAEEDNMIATSTMTTTITVTSTSTNAQSPSASAANVDATSTMETSLTSSGVPSSTAIVSSTIESSTLLSTPAASAAALNVQVVGLNSTSSSDPAVASTTLTSDSAVPTTSMAAQDVNSSSVVSTMTITFDSTTPTTSINAADVAESIAASETSSLAAPTSAVTDKVTSSTSMPTAAAVDGTLTSETASSSAPTITARAVSTAPYQWVFRAESGL